MNAYFTAMKSYLRIYAVNAYQLRKMRTSWQLCIHFKKVEGGHLVFSRWPKIYSICLTNNMRTNYKFEVYWGSGSKDIAFTSIYYLLLHIFQKADGGHLDFSRWPKNQIFIFKNIK